MSLYKFCLTSLLLLFTLIISAQDIKWMTWEEAAAANEKQPKKIFVDVYTDWCGWCKKMDATTFKDPEVVNLINSKFYAIKLNAEQKESIRWRDVEFKWTPSGRDGYNTLAFELLEGQLSYPSYIMLDEEFTRILISPGYKDSTTLRTELKFAAEEEYKTSTWDAFKAKNQ